MFIRRVSNVQFPYAFYFLGAGTGAAYFLRLPSFFGSAPVSVFFSSGSNGPLTCYSDLAIFIDFVIQNMKK